MLSMSWRMVRLLTDKYENDTLEDRKNDMAEEADLAETAPLIVCDSLVKIYKTKEVEVLALQGLDLTVNRGELMAIIGKSGSGKSTLLNYLTGAGILAENKLFATLDPTTRQFVTENGVKLLLTDTVGFIRNLPHHLIKAFKSTLDEAVFSDILMIVIDASDPEFISQTEVTTSLLEELGAAAKPMIYVFNKCDACTDRDALLQMKTLAAKTNTEVVFISAKTGAGCDKLVETLEKMAQNGKKHIKLFIPPEEGGITGTIYKEGDNVVVDYCEDGIRCECDVDEKLLAKLKKYIVEE